MKTIKCSISAPLGFSQQVPKEAIVTCVYWEEEKQWSVKGCWATFSNENYTVCSCSHLSTFALIMQIAEVHQISIYKVGKKGKRDMHHSHTEFTFMSADLIDQGHVKLGCLCA